MLESLIIFPPGYLMASRLLTLSMMILLTVPVFDMVVVNVYKSGVQMVLGSADLVIHRAGRRRVLMVEMRLRNIIVIFFLLRTKKVVHMIEY